MMKTSRAVARAAFVASAVSAWSAVAALRFPAGAAEFNYKVGSDEPIAHPNAARLQQAIEKIVAESGGRIDLKLFPNNALGGTTRMLAQLREGALEFLSVGDNVLTTIVPVCAINTIPFAFAHYKDAWSTMEGPLGAYIRNSLAKANIYKFARSWDAGMRQISTSVRPVVTPDDLKGLKMRVPEAPVTVALFRALGSSPTAINASEEYSALQTHLVDGFEQPLIGIESNHLYEVSKYISMTSHMWTAYSVVSNVDAWQKLPKNLQDIIGRNLDAFAVLERNDIVRTDDTLVTRLKGQGIAFNQADVGSFKAAIRKAGLYAQWRDQFGPEVWGMLEKSVGKLV